MFEDSEGVGASAHRTEAGAVAALREGVRDHYEVHGLGLMRGSVDAARERLADKGMYFWLEEVDLGD